MSTKASPPNPVIQVKKEVGNDEIKDFAETAMNELLGWYGYENVDKIDLHNKTSRHKPASGCVSSEENSVPKEGSLNANTHQDDSNMCQDSSRDSISPNSIKNCEKQATNCGWCKRTVPENSPEFLTTPDGPRYCSESCFTQSRRASFKRAKTCDWCRHVRHAVSYVDFQDGASQLQFCSDKCLNQYKMQIFCRETQAHLDMNPHLKEKGVDTGSGLITPELWLRNCRSRSATPEHSELSRSPTPTQSTTSSQPVPPIYKPMISVAPPSKLLSRPQIVDGLSHSARYNRKRKLSRLTTASSSGGTSNPGATTCISNNFNSNPSISVDSMANPTIAAKSPCTFSGVQDLRINTPAPAVTDRSLPVRSGLPTSYFSTPLPSTFNMHPSFFNNPRLLGIDPQHHPLPPPMLPPPIDPIGMSSIFGQPLPPVTVMVPYPVIIPLPIPIPIPLPIIDFIQANESRKNGAISTDSEATMEPLQPELVHDEPLDFTKSKNHSPDIVEETQRNEEPIVEKIDPPPTTVLAALNEIDREIPARVKLTRLNSKRPTSSNGNMPRELESSRPLRKRKRVIDCDYAKTTTTTTKDDERTRSRK